MKRLIGAIVDGFGHAAGRALFDELGRKLTDEARAGEGGAPPAETAEQRAARERAERIERERVEAQLLADARKREARLEVELAELKRRMKKGG